MRSTSIIAVVFAVIISIGISPTLDQDAAVDQWQVEIGPTEAMAAGNEGKNAISVEWSFDCREVEVSSLGAPIHTIRVLLFDGGRLDISRYDGSTLDSPFSISEEIPIKSIHVKIHDPGYSGPGLGTKSKCIMQGGDDFWGRF